MNIKISQIRYHGPQDDWCVEYICGLRNKFDVVRQLKSCRQNLSITNILTMLSNPAIHVYFIMLDEKPAGIAYTIPKHANSCESHIILEPDAEIRSHSVELGKAAIAEHLRQCPHITHIFAYIPVDNRPSVFAAMRMGFQKLCEIREYSPGCDCMMLCYFREKNIEGTKVPDGTEKINEAKASNT